MVALVATLCLSQAPELVSDERLDRLITVAVPAQEVSELFADLGSSTLTLSVANPFDEDIVAIRVKNMPLRELMQQTAGLLKLEWRKTDRGYQLFETAERKKQAAAELQIERIGRLRAWRNEHRERFKQPRPDFDDIAVQLSREREEPLPDFNKNREAYLERGKQLQLLEETGDPARWFATSIIAGLSDSQLTSLLDDGAITFSATPNRLQHKLPAGVGADLNAWTIREGVGEPAAGARLRMVDAEQVKVSVYFRSDTGRGANEFFMPITSPSLPANDRHSKGTALDEDLDIEGYLGMRWGMQNRRMPNERVLQLIAESITDPDKREPLETMAGAGLVEIAEETGTNLIALLSDDMIANGSEGMLPTNGRKLLAQFCDDVRASYSEQNGLIAVRPLELSLSRAKQFPRKYFRQVATATARQRLLPFSEVARIVSECTDLQLEGRYFRDYLTRKAARQEFTLLRTWGDTSVFRFWHSLGDSEMDALLSGGIQMGRLDPTSRKLLWRAVSLGGTTMSGEGAFNQIYKGPIGNDPTVVFPNGFPASEILEAHVKSDDCVLSSFTPWNRPIWVSQSIEKFSDFAGPNKADMTKIRLGTSHHVSIVVDKLAWSANVRQDVFDYSKPMIAWDSAPERFKARFEQAKRNPPGSGIIIR